MRQGRHIAPPTHLKHDQLTIFLFYILFLNEKQDIANASLKHKAKVFNF